MVLSNIINVVFFLQSHKKLKRKTQTRKALLTTWQQRTLMDALNPDNSDAFFLLLWPSQGQTPLLPASLSPLLPAAEITKGYRHSPYQTLSMRMFSDLGQLPFLTYDLREQSCWFTLVDAFVFRSSPGLLEMLSPTFWFILGEGKQITTKTALKSCVPCSSGRNFLWFYHGDPAGWKLPVSL